MDPFTSSWFIEKGFQYGFTLLFAGVAVHSVSSILSKMAIGSGATLIAAFLLAFLLTSKGASESGPTPMGSFSEKSATATAAESTLGKGHSE